MEHFYHNGLLLEPNPVGRHVDSVEKFEHLLFAILVSIEAAI